MQGCLCPFFTIPCYCLGLGVEEEIEIQYLLSYLASDLISPSFKNLHRGFHISIWKSCFKNKSCTTDSAIAWAGSIARISWDTQCEYLILYKTIWCFKNVGPQGDFWKQSIKMYTLTRAIHTGCITTSKWNANIRKALHMLLGAFIFFSVTLVFLLGVWGSKAVL